MLYNTVVLASKRHYEAALDFPVLLHQYLIDRAPLGRSVYDRVIAPALESRAGRSLLDPERFAAQLGPNFNIAAHLVNEIVTGSKEEMLALFALAFALRQPEEGYAIVHPLLIRGSGFIKFFGASRIIPDGREKASGRGVGEAEPGSTATWRRGDRSRPGLSRRAIKRSAVALVGAGLVIVGVYFVFIYQLSARVFLRLDDWESLSLYYVGSLPRPIHDTTFPMHHILSSAREVELPLRADEVRSHIKGSTRIQVGAALS
jgi:hypothetical protein